MIILRFRDREFLKTKGSCDQFTIVFCFSDLTLLESLNEMLPFTVIFLFGLKDILNAELGIEAASFFAHKEQKRYSG